MMTEPVNTKQGLESIKQMKDLFIEGCAEGYYSDMEAVKNEAQHLREMEQMVKGFTDFLESDDKENYDMKKLLESLKL